MHFDHARSGLAAAAFERAPPSDRRICGVHLKSAMEKFE
jgi:hypothetical protein